jgi:hypothetical protein
LFDGGTAAQNDQVSYRHSFPAGLSVVERLLDSSRVSSTVASWAGWLTSQSFCGARRIRAPFAPPRLSEPRKVEADAQAVETSSEIDSPEAKDFGFEIRDVGCVDQLVIDWRNGILPDQSSEGTSGPR